MKLILLVIFIFIGSISSFSQSRGSSIINHSDILEGNTYAIIIGISNYMNLPPLQYADKDAIAFYDYLVSEKGMNVDSSNVTLWINKEANINNLGNSVSDILQKNLKKGDRIIFFFAGHGDYDAKIMQDQALLLLQGAPKGNYFQNVFSGDYISTSDLHIKFTSELIKKGAEVMLIIDACHSGGINSKLAGGEQGGIITANALNTIQSTVKFYSCQANQYSIESTQFGGGRGLFSYVFMEGLYGLADANNDKVLSLKELQRYLEDNVPLLALPDKQDPVIKIEDNTKIVCIINDDLLNEYKNEKDKNLSFLASVNVKGNEEAWLSGMSLTQQEQFKTCKLLIENKKLEDAYKVYKLYELQDKTSNASIFLRRNLSAALQEKTAKILSPMLEDVSKFESNLKEIEQAKDDLDKAAELLGSEHFLYDKLQARKLFLKGLEIILNGDKKKKAKECIEYLEQSVSLEPNAPYPYFSLSGLYSLEGNTEAAEKNIKKYLDLIPSSSWAHYNYGILLYDLKRFEETEKEYKKTIELDPGNANVHYNYGILLEDLNRNKEAEKEYKRAIELNPNFDNAHCNYGLLLQYLNRQKEAELEYIRAIEINPNNKIVHNNYGLLLSNSKRFDEAENEFKKAISLNPKNPNIYYNLACVYSLKGETDNTISNFRKALQLGLRKLDNWQTDSDLDNIRTSPEFKSLLSQYYTQQELDQYPNLFLAQ